MAERSFIEVLEDKIRADLREEIEAEFQARREEKPSVNQTAAHPANTKAWTETWLAANSKRFSFARNGYRAGRKPQGPGNTAPKKPEAPRRRAETSEAVGAVAILERQTRQQLPELFSMDDVKSIWRKAALNSHPDRFMQAGPDAEARAAALFRDSQSAYEILVGLFD